MQQFRDGKRDRVGQKRISMGLDTRVTYTVRGQLGLDLFGRLGQKYPSISSTFADFKIDQKLTKHSKHLLCEPVSASSCTIIEDITCLVKSILVLSIIMMNNKSFVRDPLQPLFVTILQNFDDYWYHPFQSWGCSPKLQLLIMLQSTKCTLCHLSDTHCGKCLPVTKYPHWSTAVPIFVKIIVECHKRFGVARFDQQSIHNLKEFFLQVIINVFRWCISHLLQSIHFNFTQRRILFF